MGNWHGLAKCCNSWEEMPSIPRDEGILKPLYRSNPFISVVHINCWCRQMNWQTVNKRLKLWSCLCFRVGLVPKWHPKVFQQGQYGAWISCNLSLCNNVMFRQHMLVSHAKLHKEYISLWTKVQGMSPTWTGAAKSNCSALSQLGNQGIRLILDQNGIFRKVTNHLN